MTGTLDMSGSEATRFRKVVIAFFGIQHPFIHVDVDDLGTVFNLLAGYVQSGVVIFFNNQAFEACRAGYITTFTHIDKQESAKILKGSRPLKRQATEISGICRLSMDAILSAIALI